MIFNSINFNHSTALNLWGISKPIPELLLNYGYVVNFIQCFSELFKAIFHLDNLAAPNSGGWLIPQDHILSQTFLASSSRNGLII
jgi:hypothetical protein